MKIFLCVLFFCLCFSAIRAQTSFNIGGLIKTSVGDPVDAATVFINGSKQVTKTDIKSEFVFINVSPGTYQLVVNMIGYP